MNSTMFKLHCHSPLFITTLYTMPMHPTPHEIALPIGSQKEISMSLSRTLHFIFTNTFSNEIHLSSRAGLKKEMTPHSIPLESPQLWCLSLMMSLQRPSLTSSGFSTTPLTFFTIPKCMFSGLASYKLQNTTLLTQLENYATGNYQS